MPKARLEVNCVLSGGGGHVVALAGGCTELDEHVDICAIGGASAGAARAGGQALGVEPGEMLGLMHEILTDNKLKDLDPGDIVEPFSDFGIYRGLELKKALRRVFGNKTMGQAYIPLRIMVCDLWTRRPEVIDSQRPEHKGLLVVDVLAASAAIPGFFKAQKLPQLRGNRLFVDGGTAANFAMGLFDDTSRPTIGLRLEPRSPDFMKPVTNVVEWAEAMAELLMWASDNAHVSSRHAPNVIRLPQLGSGLDFDLAPELIDQRWTTAREAVKLALPAILERLSG